LSKKLLKINLTMIRKTADKIVSYKTVSAREKVDRLLELNAKQYTNLGTDSSKQERALAESNSRYIYRKIKTVNPLLGSQLLRVREE
jgi:hypothetical protein